MSACWNVTKQVVLNSWSQAWLISRRGDWLWKFCSAFICPSIHTLCCKFCLQPSHDVKVKHLLIQAVKWLSLTATHIATSISPSSTCSCWRCKRMASSCRKTTEEHNKMERMATLHVTSMVLFILQFSQVNCSAFGMVRYKPQSCLLVHQVIVCPQTNREEIPYC